MKADRARPVHLDGTDQLVAMLDAARELVRKIVAPGSVLVGGRTLRT
jgi:hypothetical protein